MWKGVVIEESLRNKGLLGIVKIVGTKEKTLEGEQEKGILHFHNIAVDDRKKASL